MTLAELVRRLAAYYRRPRKGRVTTPRYYVVLLVEVFDYEIFNPGGR